MTYNCIIVDDEPIARQIVEGYIAKLPHLKLIKICQDAFEALTVIKTHSVDIIFLDINMPQLNGLGLISSLSVSSKIIITSAYQEHAIEGFELAVTDYLLKPFSIERFIKAVDKAISEIPITPEHPKQDSLFIKSEGKILRMNFSDIYYIEGYGNYIKIHCTDGMHLSAQTITGIEQQLSSSLFIRIHKSYIINLSHLKSIEGNRIWIKSFEVPIGETYKKKLMAVLKLD
jgi:two-component system, LytTR family, response regulator